VSAIPETVFLPVPEVAPPDLSAEARALWPGFVSDLAAMWPNADSVSEVELVLLADVLRTVTDCGQSGRSWRRLGPS
jgi:hypothetical protein